MILLLHFLICLWTGHESPPSNYQLLFLPGIVMLLTFNFQMGIKAHQSLLRYSYEKVCLTLVKLSFMLVALMTSSANSFGLTLVDFHLHVKQVSMLVIVLVWPKNQWYESGQNHVVAMSVTGFFSFSSFIVSVVC